MAKNWWENDPISDDKQDNWWSSDPVADDKQAAAQAPDPEPAQEEAKKSSILSDIRATISAAAQGLSGTPAAQPRSRSVMEGYKPKIGDPGFDPMLNPQFVEEFRNELGSLPAENRLTALRQYAQNDQSVYGRAARVILSQEENANAKVTAQNRREAQGLVGLAPAPTAPRLGGGGAASRPAFVEATPNFLEQFDGVTPEQKAKLEALARTLAESQEATRRNPEKIQQAAEQARIDKFVQDNPALGWVYDKYAAETLKGVGIGIKALSDVFGASNTVSDGIQSVVDGITRRQSSQQKALETKRGEIMEEYADGGIIDQLKGAAKAFAVDPAGLMFNTLGIMGSTVAGGRLLSGTKAVQSIGAAGAKLLGKAGSITAATTAGAAITGGAMGAGFAKGAIYDSVYEMAKAEGYSDADAERIANKAQSYTENPDVIALVSVATAAGAGTGLEPMLLNMFGKESAKQLLKQGVIKSVAGSVAREVPLEMLQGGSEALASNVAAARAGFDVAPMRGVWTNAFLEGMASGGMAAAGGVAQSNLRLRDETQQEAAARSLTDALQGADIQVAGGADATARALLDPNAYDPSLVSPQQTARTAFDMGPSAPAGLVGGAMSFTPADSVTAQAGLPPIVVPEPGAINVGATTVPEPGAAARGQQPGALGGTGMGLPGLGGLDAGGRSGGDTAGVGAMGGQAAPLATAGGQQAATLTRGPLARSSDADLLSRAQAAAGINNANTPVEQWFGRKGDGYITQGDAQQALPGRQRMFPNLDWTIEQMPNGKFRLAGYESTQQTGARNAATTTPTTQPQQGQETAQAITSQETNLGTQAPQAQQAEAQGQETPATSAREFNDFTRRQPRLPDTVFAGLSRNPQSADIRSRTQAYLDSLVNTGRLPSVPQLGTPDADAEGTINALGNLFGAATGIGNRVIAYNQPGGDNGFALSGIAFVNTAMDSTSVDAPRTAWHELRHVAEQMAKAGNQPAREFTAAMDGIFDDMTDAGKRAYVENFLFKGDLAGITDPAAREARINELMQSPKLRSEMVADFLGNRSQDRQFLASLAQADPQGFEGFVQKWLAVIDNLIAKLRGGKTQGEKESAKVDQYVRDLNRAKMVARDALIAFRKGNLVAQQQTEVEAMPASLRQPDFTDPEDRVAVSTAQPTAKPDRKTGYQPSSFAEKRVIDAQDIKASEKHVKTIVDALRKYNTLSGKGDAAKVMQELHDVVVENLLWLHDHVTPEARERAKLWYDGANRIANDWTKKFNTNLRQTGGILAVFSPQMDWFKNVSLAERALVVMTRHADETWSKGMTDWAESWLNASADVATKNSRTADLENMRRIAAEGKKLKDMSNEDAAYFIRAFDEAYFPRNYRLVTPEGGFDGFVFNDDGETMASVTWGGFGTIEKAVSIFRDGSFRNVDQQLGGEHKVRNFYNNIVDPNSADGHVTIDTHAVAAAFVKPLSGASVEVAHNLGGLGSNAATGASGSYALYADAYRDAATKRGLLAREMQSITWEAVRALFPAETKSGLAAGVGKVWDRVKAGEITREQARQEIVKLAGGVRAFAWEGGGAGQFAEDGATSFETVVASDPAAREVRTLTAKDAKDKIQVSLSAATTTIPGIRKLYELAQGKDQAAHALLQNIAFDSMKHLLSGTSASVQTQPATGLYGGASEPSLALTVTFTDNERDIVLASLEKFAQNFNQEQVHVRQGTKAKAGTKFDDGSYATPVYRWELSKSLDRKQIQKVIDQSGLYGLTFGDTFVEAYFVGDVSNEQEFTEFEAAIERASGLLRKSSTGAGRSVARLWPYGYGDGAIGYERIRGDITPREALTSQTAKRVAEYLKGAKVKVFEQASEITPQQAELQGEIARVYESLPDNDLKNPRVRKAYSELAKEVVRQFNALPIKVEVMTGQGEPYASSAAMRRDILNNNHLFIFGTTPETFGPPGADFTGHPLLEDTGLKDQNGYPLLANDLLRAVHDYYAHAMAPTQFGPKGEEAAWKNHMSMTTSPWARWALTSETRGQNSWVNFRPLAQGLPITEREFARQKAVLMPIEYAMTGDKAVDSVMRELEKSLPEAARKGTKPEKTGDMPAFSARQADVTPMGFYSELARQIDKGPGQAPKDQWKAYIKGLQGKGVKADEIEWTGINDWLDLQEGKVKKADVMDYLNANGVQIDETTLGDADKWVVRVAGDPETHKFDTQTQAEQFVEDEIAYQLDGQVFDDDGQYDMAREEAADRVIMYEPGEWLSVAKYEKWTLPGGANYREVLITLPVQQQPSANAMAREMFGRGMNDLSPADQEAVRSRLRADEAATTFTSGHWDQKNVVAHLRLNDRTAADGSKVLFVEELQSDWGQDGKKKGFRKDPAEAQAALNAHLRSLTEKYGIDGMAAGKATQAENAETQRLTNEVQAAVSGVVPAPFVTKTEGWLNLGLKRVAQLAVEGGYDKVAFVNGKQSADRYDLSKQVQQVMASKNNDGTMQIFFRDTAGKNINAGAFPVDGLADVVGKDLAEKIAAQTKQYDIYKGGDLKVGGEGMMKFYDIIVPTTLKKLLPKIGGTQMGSVDMRGASNGFDYYNDGDSFVVIDGDNRFVTRFNTAEQAAAEVDRLNDKEQLTQPGFDVTDKMRETVEAGLPLFSQRQEDVVSSPEFQRWFGDSKVVDAEGKPLVVYHGTGFGFNKFISYRGDLIYFARTPESAESYAYGVAESQNEMGNYDDDIGRRSEDGGASIYPVYLSAQNIFDPDNEAHLSRLPDAIANELRESGGDYDSVEPSQSSIRDAGFDGVYVRETPDVESADRDIAVFRPEQIKSATGNQGTFDPNDPDIRRSQRQAAVIGQNFQIDEMSRIDRGRRVLQDDALRMKRVLEAVRKQGGVVGEAQNFYEAYTLMPGRVQAAMDDFRDNVVRPMIDKATNAGIGMEDLALYAYAKHAAERNAYIASINPRLPDGGSGMTDADAAKIIADVAATGKQAEYDDLHRDLMAITATTRQTMLNEGLISQEEFDAMEGAYQNYIPLRGFENVDEETGAIRPGVGRGINVRGAETIRALGRSSRAGDLIENVIRDYQRVVSRVELNDVGKVLLDFVLSNPDPDLWGVDVERTKASFDKKRGVVQYTTAIEKGEDTIGIKVGGQQVYIKFADKDLSRALRKAWKDEVSGLERATVVVSGWWNNWMRNVLTQYNPLFAAINIPRDALWSGTTAALADLGPKGLAMYAKNYAAALVASGRSEAGFKNPNSQLDRQFEEFRASGGITGGFYMRSLEDINADLRNDLLKAGATPKGIAEIVKNNLWNQVPGMAAALQAAGMNPAKANRVASLISASRTAKLLQFIGSASENATRFALYMAAKDVGKTPAQAALLAKNGTTNFNRKGEWGGTLNNLYLFYNASVQGLAQLLYVLKSPAVQKAMAGVAGVGMMAALYGASVGGEDDDGEAYWDKVPSFEKERNLIIMLPPGDALGDGIERVGKRGRYIKIPVQYGFNIFPNLGYVVADMYRNQQDPRRGLTPVKGALHMTSVVFGSANPFGGAVDLSDGVQVLLAVAPTLVDLPIQLINERNSFGQPASPERSSWDTRPDSERMFVSQMDTVPASIAKALNELGGGNEAKAGSIMGVETSVTPGTIKTLISSTTGGLGTFIEQMASSVVAMADDEKDLKASNTPFVNKFYGEVDEGANMRLASDRMREVRNAMAELEGQFKVGLTPKIGTEEQRTLALAEAQSLYEKAMTDMRKAEIEIIKSQMTDAEKKLARQQIRVARDQLATTINKLYLDSLKKPE